MKIAWSINTGYVSRIPDWIVEVPDEDLEGLSEVEQDRVIDEYVQDEFANRVGISWTRKE